MQRYCNRLDMCSYTFTLDDRLVEKLTPQFSSSDSMQRWLQKEFELLVIHHAEALMSEGGKEHSRLLRRINDLGRLVTGWDGLAAEAPSQEALRQATIMIDYLPEDILSYCAIFPSNDSNVYFQAKLPAGRLTAYLDGKAMTYVLKSHGNMVESKKKEVDAIAISELASTIKAHCMA